VKVRGTAARALVLLDAADGRVLLARHEHRSLPIASLTKVMTAVLGVRGGHLSQELRIRKQWLGIGGSSLGGQALTALRKVSKPFVEFHDNPDPFSWIKALKRFDLKKTHFIAISKSGGTAETLMQVLTAADALEKLGVERRLMTAGENKGFLDPFSPQTEKHRVFAQGMLDQIHKQFIDVVKAGRGKRLKESPELFTGLFWTGQQAVEMGLADQLGNLDFVAREIVKQFPNVSKVAITLRESLSASHNNWGAMLYDVATDSAHFAPLAGGEYTPYQIKNIVDRVGGGDSFGAGLIFALNTPELAEPPKAIAYAVAASCLAHSIVGDINYTSRAEAESLMKGSASGRVVR